LEVLINSSES